MDQIVQLKKRWCGELVAGLVDGSINIRDKETFSSLMITASFFIGSQKEIASELGVSTGQMSRWCNGESVPRSPGARQLYGKAVAGVLVTKPKK